MPRPDLERRTLQIRRLIIVAAVLLVLIACAAGLYVYNSSSGDEGMIARVEESKTAFDEGDYEKVIQLLEDRQSSTNTIRFIQRDADALYRYVKARREVPLNNGEHVALLFPALRQVVTLDPSNTDAGRTLLTVQLLYGRDNEALTTASRLIEVHPDNAEFLQYRGAIYDRMGKQRDALADVWASLEIEPLNVRASADAARLTDDLHEDPTRFVDWAKEIHDKHRDDPRALVIHGQSMLLQADRPQAEQAFLDAADKDPIDTDFAQTLVEWLDRTDAYARSMTYLQAHAGQGFSNLLGEELLYRHYERGEYEKATQRFLAGDASKAEPDLVGVAAISAQRSDNTDLANKLLGTLKEKKTNAYAQAWAALLEQLWADQTTPGQIIKATNDALKHRNENPHLSYILGNTLMQIGEYESALVPLQVSGRVRPSWAQPRYQMARVALLYGRPDQAQRLAHEAVLRESRVAYADLEAAAQAYLAEPRDAQAVAAAIQKIQEVQQHTPGSPRSLLALINLYSRTDQPDAARDTITQALAIQPPLDQQTMTELAQQAGTLSPALGKQVGDRLEQLYGASPAITLAQAMALADAGKIGEGATLLESATPTPPTPQWQSARARYLSYTQSPDAAAAWIDMADAYPGDLEVQSVAVAEVPLAEHRAFAQRAIQRMRTLGGETSIGWRIARARLLLTADNPAAAAPEAGTLLREALASAPNRPDAHRLLSRVYELTNDPAAAILSMQQATRLDPDNIPSQYRLGQMLHNQHRYQEAHAPLLQVAGSPAATSEMRLNAMTMLARQGEMDTLIPIAEAMSRNKLGGTQVDILLSELYLAAGRINNAQQIADKLLKSPNPQSIAYLAEFFDRIGQPERAEKAIALLDTIEVPQSQRSEILALFAARRDNQLDALNHFRAAAQAAPDEAHRWRTLVAMDLLFSQPQQALEDAKQAQALNVQDPGLAAVVNNSDIFLMLATDARFARLASSIVSDTAHRDAGLNALRTIKQAAEHKQTLATIASALSKQAQANPDYLPLQLITIQLYMQARQPAPAADLAVQVMNRFSSDPESARLAAITLIDIGDWRRGMDAAQTWSQRSPEYKNYADVLLATAQRNLGRYDDAIKTLEPYIAQARLDPVAHIALLREYTWAQAQRGQADKAWAILAPQLTTDLAWRQLAGRIAGRTLTDPATATTWLKAVDQATPADNTAEQIILVQAEYDAATRLNNSDLLQTAKARTDRILAGANPPAEALYLQGMIAEGQDDLAQAEQSYRRLLSLSPQAHPAMNNLAMVLIRRGRNLDDAVHFATAATQAQPQDPNYLDTLAQAYAAKNDHKQALAAINRAIDLDRNGIGWYLTKADILEASGDIEAAKLLRERYQTQP